MNNTDLGKISQYPLLESKEYIKHSLSSLNKENTYRNTHFLYNPKTDTSYIPKPVSIKDKRKEKYLNFLFKINEIEESLNKEDYSSYFITLTLPSEYHKYKKTNQDKLILNKKYKGYSIKEGSDLLNKSFRNLVKNSTLKKKRVKFEYAKAIEPHKNLTSHLHSIIYVPKNYETKFLKRVEKNSKFYSLGKQKDIKRLDDSKGAIGYLVKYINKSNDTKNNDFNHFIEGYYKSNNIIRSSYSRLKNSFSISSFKKINSSMRLTKYIKQNPFMYLKENAYYKRIEKEFSLEGSLLKNKIIERGTTKEKSLFRIIENKFYKLIEGKRKLIESSFYILDNLDNIIYEISNWEMIKKY